MPLYPPASSGSGYTPGGTDVAVTDGGTGASTASGARTNLGVAIGTDVRAQGSGDPTRSTLGLSTTDAPQFTAINLGNASDTTITRVSAGVIAVEGVTIPTSASFLTNNEGGQDTIMAHGSMGSTETFDPTDGNVHTGVLDANCTFTLNAPVGSGAATIALYITASGTRTWTWPGSVAWPGGVTPAAPADGVLSTVILTTVDGGTTWYGGIAGDGGAPAESAVTFTDITTNNASTSKHGYLKKLSNVSTEYMSGTGVFSTPAGSGSAYSGCKAYAAAVQSVTSSTLTPVAFDTEEWDVDGYHSTVTNNSRFTVPTGKGGKFRLTGYVRYANPGVQVTYITGWRLNGTTDLRSFTVGLQPTGGPTYANDIETVLADGDYVELLAWQNTGGALNIGDASVADNQCSASVSKIG